MFELLQYIVIKLKNLFLLIPTTKKNNNLQNPILILLILISTVKLLPLICNLSTEDNDSFFVGIRIYLFKTENFYKLKFLKVTLQFTNIIN